jgi:uncharacterized protein involved in propanediol utilization
VPTEQDERAGQPVHNGLRSVGRAFGTFGELLQGGLTDGRDFLVTLPINAWSWATLCLCEVHDRLTVSPPHKTKSLALVRRVLDQAGHSGGAHLELTSELPEGKGLASSSADLVATARALAAGLGIGLSATDIEALLRRIEPSDGVMYDGVVAFHHRDVSLRQWLGHLPPVKIVGQDRGGQVDTVAVNRRPRAFRPADRREYDRLLARLGSAMAAGDLPEITRISTRSVEMAVRGRSARRLERLRAAGREIGGLGLVLAHSGTMLGIPLPADDPEVEAKAEHVRRLVGGDVAVYGSLTTDRPG